MISFYIAELTLIYEESKDYVEESGYCILAADSFSDAAEILCEDYGENNICDMKITLIGEEDCRTLEISKSVADAFINDVMTLVECPKSKWRIDYEGEKK